MISKNPTDLPSAKYTTLENYRVYKGDVRTYISSSSNYTKPLSMYMLPRIFTFSLVHLLIKRRDLQNK